MFLNARIVLITRSLLFLVQCFCNTRGCGGDKKCKRVFRRHQVEDQENSCTEFNKNFRSKRDLKFDETLYETHWAATTKIYEGSPTSVLQAVFGRLKTFVCHPYMSKEAMSDILSTSSFAAAKELIKPFLVSLEKYHVCINDCMVFNSSSETVCTRCNQRQYIRGNKPQ